MAKLNVLNQHGEEIGNVTLNKEVFGIEPNNQAIFDAVQVYLSNSRQATAKTKTRDEVSGGGKKPWRQKGTGRARQGSIRSPQWRGGGVVFAPTPRSHAVKVNKKVVKLATKCVLSEKVAENNLIALEALTLENCKTKGLVEVLKNVNANNGKVLVLLSERDSLVELAGRNIPNVLVLTVSHASVYDLLNHDVVVLTKDAAAKYEEVLA